MSIDPVTTDANSGGGFNRYAYANNSPYKYIDPDGRLAFLAPMAWGAAVGATINVGAQLARSHGDWSRINVGQVVVAAGAGALSGGAGVIANTASTVARMIGANVVAGTALGAGGAHVSAAVDGKTASLADVARAGAIGGVLSGVAGGVGAVPGAAQVSSPGTASAVGWSNVVEGIKSTMASTGHAVVNAPPTGQAVANGVGNVISNASNVEQQPKDRIKTN